MTVALGATCAEGTVLLTDSPAPYFNTIERAWSAPPRPGDTKLVVLPKTGIAFIHSGTAPADWSLQEYWSQFDTDREPDLRFAGAAILGTLWRWPQPPLEYVQEIAEAIARRDGAPVDLEAARIMSTEHDILLANLGPEGMRLGLMTTKPESGASLAAGKARGYWLEHGSSGYLVAGAIGEWWAGQPTSDSGEPNAPGAELPATVTLREAEDLLLGIAERFHRAKYGEVTWHYRNWQRTRLGKSVELPPAIPPYVGLTWEAAKGSFRRWKVDLGKDDVFLEPAPVV